MKIIFYVLIIFTMACKPKQPQIKPLGTIADSTKLTPQAVTENNQIINTNLEKKWMLVSFKQYTKDFLTKKEAFIEFKNQTVSGQMGCNTFSYHYNVKKSLIEFSKGKITNMYCDDMALENDFNQEVLNIESYHISGHQLSLITKNGNKLQFIAADWD